MAYEIIVAKFTPDEPDERIDAVLPDGVVGIGAKAFRFKGEVRSLRAPQSLIEVGDAAFDAEVSRIRSRRAAVGETLDTAGAEKEVVANFVGNNLFTENFAEAITRQDTKLSSVFAGTFYRLRYAMDAIRNGKQAARMQYAERLFTTALDKTPGTVQLGADADGDADAEGEVAYGFDEKTQSKVTEEYQKTVDGILNGSISTRDSIIIGYTPMLMQQMGMPQLPFVIGAGHIYSIAKTAEEARIDGKYNSKTHYHGLGAETVKNIYEKLQDPVMIIASKDVNKDAVPLRSTHSVVAIVDVGNDDSSLLLPVEITAERKVGNERMDVNVLSSVYEKNVASLVKEAIAQENIGEVGVYYAKKEAISLIGAGVQFPEQLQKKMTSSPIIRSFDEKVNMKIVDATQSQQFRRWFGDWQNHPEDASKVVNEDGTPKVVYHGTNNKFWTFDLAKSGRNYGETSEGLFFFTNKRNGYSDSAEDYARAAAQNSGTPRVMECYLDIKKPLTLHSDGYYTPTAYFDKNAETVYKQYLNGDYDGIIIENSDKSVDDSVIYLLDDPIKIKSATDNIGTFDRNNPDIRHAFAEDADGGIAVEEKVQPDADAYKAYRIAQEMESAEKYRDAVREREERLVKEKQTSEEASPVEEVAQMVEEHKAEKRTKFQKKQEAELGDLLRRFKNGAISEEEYKSEQARLIDEAVAENDRKWKSGNRGPAAIREMLGSDNRYMRENYIQKEVEQERQERREKAAVAEEKKEKTALKNKVIRLMDEAKDRLAHPQKNRHIPLQHTQTIIDLLQAITVSEEEKQRYIAAAREKLGDAVYPATKTRFENQIKKAMDSGDAVSRQLDRLAMEYRLWPFSIVCRK